MPAPSKRRKTGSTQLTTPGPDFEISALEFEEGPDDSFITTRDAPTRRSARNAHILASEINRINEEAAVMIKEDKTKQKQEIARREHEKYEAMGKEVMDLHVPLLKTSDWCEFMKDFLEPAGILPNLIILDGPWGVNVDRAGDATGQNAVN